MLYRLAVVFVLGAIPFSVLAHFDPGEATIIFETNNASDQLIENCELEVAMVSVVLNSPAIDTLFFRIEDNSTAKRDTDYVSDVPDTLIIFPGEQQASFSISAINDGIPEFPDLIRYDLYSIENGGDVICNFIEIVLRDALDVSLFVIEEASSFCVPPSVTLSAQGAPNFLWTPSSLFDNPTLDTVVLESAFTDFISVNGIGPGCSESAQIQLSYTDPTFSIQKLGPDTICLGETISYNISPSDMLDDLLVSPNSWLVSNINNAVILQPDTSGWVTFEGVRDTCTYIDSVFVTVDRIVLPQLIDDLTICLGDTVHLATIGFNTDLTMYSWSPVLGLNNPFLPNPIAIPTASTVYNLTSTGNLGFCIVMDSVQVDVLDTRIDYNVIDNSAICLGDTVVAILDLRESASVSLDPDLSGLVVGDTILFFPNEDQLYTISIDFGFCRDSLLQEIQVTDATVITEIISDSVICLGDSIVIKVKTNESPLSLTWTPDNILIGQTDSTYIFLPDSSLSLDLVVDFGLCQYTESFDITSRDNRFDIELDAINELCKGDVIIGFVSFNEQPDNFTFSPIEGYRQSGDTLFFNPQVTTQYTFSADYGACDVVREFDMEVDSLPNLNLSIIPNKEAFCSDESILVSSPAFSLESYPDIQYEWSPDDANLISDPLQGSAQFTALTNGTFTRTTTNHACKSLDTFDLAIVSGKISPLFFDTSICMGSTIQFDISDQDISSLLWTPENNLSCSDCPNPIMSPSITTVYNLDYERNGCPFDEQFTVRIVEIDSLVLDPIEGCKDAMVQVNITEPLLANGIWDQSENLSCTICTDPTVVLENSQTYTIRDFSGECERVGLLTSTVFPVVDIQLILQNTTPVFIGQEVIVSANVTNTQNPNIVWIVNDVVDVETSSTLSFTAVEFNYDIVAQLTDDLTLCDDQDALNFPVDVIDEIVFPNLFSPNGDNVNDVFKPSQADALTINSFKIFNRWGQTIYESNDSQASWDGRTMSGKEAAVDTYIYIVSINQIDSQEEIIRGEVSLVR